MNTEERAAEVLRQAESNLRELVSAAAAAGDYASVLRVAAWAKALSDLAKEASVGHAPTNTADHGTHPAMPHRAKNPSAATNTAAKAAYPRFFRQGDQLVRIAWSKKEKAEYVHKTPYTVLQAVVEALAEAGRDGRVFSTKQFLPIREKDGTEIPSYQAYVTIALLKQLMLIDQHGRQGYSIPKLADLKDAVEAVWRKLPEQ